MEIKLPGIRIDSSEEAQFSLGRLSPSLTVGFGIHWAWVYLVMFSGDLFYFSGKGSAEETTLMFYMASLAFFALALLAYAVAFRPLRRLFFTREVRYTIRAVGAGLTCVGTLLVALADAGTALGLLALWAGAACAGVGSVILLMSHGISFGQCDIATITTSTAAALVAGMFAYALLLEMAAAAPLAAFVVTALLPWAECYCLYKNSSILIDRLEFSQTTLKIRRGPFALRIGVPGLLFGFVLGIMRTSALGVLSDAESSSLRILGIVGACVLTSALIMIVLLTQKQRLNFLFRPLAPLVALILLGSSLYAGETSVTWVLTVLGGYLLLENAMWINYSDIMQRYRISPFIVFGFGRGTLALGTLVSVFVTSACDLGPIGQHTVLCVMLTAILWAYVALPQEDDIRRLLIQGSEGAADSIGGEGRASSNGQAAQSPSGWFKRKCGMVADRYLLSRRETEVLFLLAKGRNAAHIQKQLYISDSTTRTHIRHIYKKLDIHTQQALIDMIDSLELAEPSVSRLAAPSVSRYDPP
ncbi:MAG: helix-turn-helix transcriptional regulator, partial [Coriobacteriales bacterium]|nr:helix-turn-helix transcriptional regulator [Coriobacteriales bacterium]